MEIGYDYLLHRPRFQQRFIQASSLLLFVTGALLLIAGIAYFVYAQNATSNLVNLNVVTQPPASIDPGLTNAGAVVGIGSIDAATAALIALAEGAGVVPVVPLVPSSSDEVVAPPADQIIDTDPGNTLPIIDVGADPLLPDPADLPLPDNTSFQISSDAIASQQLYPGQLINPSAWSDILEYEPASSLEASLIQGFVPVDPSFAPPPGTLTSPNQIIIPSIGVDSNVEGLQIRNLGDSRAYETPNNIVGHIPEGSNPGESGSTWYFGHLESPIAREGNVFYELPKIPEMLRKGQDVYAVVESDSGSFLYQITEAMVVKAEDLSLSYEHLQQQNPDFANLDPNGANLHLVACVPRFVYDHRLVVSGQLIGVRQ